jgi:hypothetical protein
MSTNGKERIALDPEAPGLDEDTRRRRRALVELQRLSVDELFRVAVRAGIYTEDGELTPPTETTASRAPADRRTERRSRLLIRDDRKHLRSRKHGLIDDRTGDDEP